MAVAEKFQALVSSLFHCTCLWHSPVNISSASGWSLQICQGPAYALKPLCPMGSAPSGLLHALVGGGVNTLLGGRFVQAAPPAQLFPSSLCPAASEHSGDNSSSDTFLCLSFLTYKMQML